MSSQLRDWILRTPDADRALGSARLEALLKSMGKASGEAAADALIAFWDDPRELVRELVLATDALDHLTERQAAFAASAYDHVTAGEVARAPGDLARIVGCAFIDSAAEPTTEQRTVIDPSYGLYPHQLRAAQALLAELRPSGTAVLLHMPTGAGKTRTAMNVVCDHLRSHTEGVVVWAASNKELLQQASEEFVDAWGYLGNRKVPLARGWDGNTLEAASATDGLVVCTLQGLHQLRSTRPEMFAALSARTTLMVFDEAHQALAPTYSAVSLGLAERGRLLGLSATPGRTADGGTDADLDLAEIFQGRKVTLDTTLEGDANPVRYLISERYLAEPTFEVITLPRPHQEAADGEREPDVEYTARVIDEAVRLVADGHRRIMVFAASVEHCRLVAAGCAAKGFRCRTVLGDTAGGARRAAIEWIKDDNPEARVIVNFGVLTTGFDAPKITAALIARQTKSLVTYSQMVGRAIRGTKAGGTDTAVVRTVVNSDNRSFRDIAMSFVNWEQAWEQA